MDFQQFADYLASMLCVPRPSVRYAAMLGTPTQLAAMDPDTLVLTLRRSASELDKAFSVAHELRHLWQRHTGRFPFSAHAAPGTLSVADYNSQLDEIDANAFAALIMEMCFGVRPTFSGLSPDLVAKIKHQKETILQEEFKS